MKKQLWLFLFGGAVYYLIEVIYKGSSHWAMFFVGGVAFRFIGWVRVTLSRLHLLWQCALCGVLVTFVEFVSGCILNLRCHWSLWDYSHLPYNVLGQVCLPFTLAWAFLSVPALQMDKLLCRHLAKTSVPTRKISKKLHRHFG